MSESPSPPPQSNRGLWVGLAVGAPVVAYGIGGALVDGRSTHPTELAAWVIGVALVHDLVVVPATLAVGTALRRFIPADLWSLARWALVTSAVLTAFALPFARGYGRDPNIPSLFNRNYALGLAAYVVVVCCAAIAAAGVLRIVRRRPDLSAPRVATVRRDTSGAGRQSTGESL